MHFGSSPSKVLPYLGTFAAGVLFAWAANPLWREVLMAWHQEPYGALVEKCDDAMRTHYQAKQLGGTSETGDTLPSLRAAEIGLIVCQDYDLYQKRMLQLGLREDELAQMRLKAIEARSSDLEDVIETHEIRY